MNSDELIRIALETINKDSHLKDNFLGFKRVDVSLLLPEWSYKKEVFALIFDNLENSAANVWFVENLNNAKLEDIYLHGSCIEENPTILEFWKKERAKFLFKKQLEKVLSEN